MASLHDLPSPSLLVDQRRLTENIRSLQRTCDTAGIELRPHVKTHKLVPVAAQQLAAGARGLTCAKIGEAEALLPSGVRSMFIAHSLVDPRQAPRLAALAEQLDDLRVAVTSEAQLAALAPLARQTGKKLSVMMALDSGLGREGVREIAAAQRLAAKIAAESALELRGFYTHEGHFYGRAPAERAAGVAELIARLSAMRDAIDPQLALWPGCSVTAPEIVATAAGRVQAVRPGAYVFGDLFLTTITGIMTADQVALHVLATVVDKPEPGLALIDAGSKTFSSDRTPENVFAVAADGRDVKVMRVNEEHGYLRGSGVDTLAVGERILFTPAHVCTVVNLANEVAVVEDGRVTAHWAIDARGCTQ